MKNVTKVFGKTAFPGVIALNVQQEIEKTGAASGNPGLEFNWISRRFGRRR